MTFLGAEQNVRKYAFFFHFNKPETQRRGHPVISIHFRGQCFLVRHVVVPMPTRDRIQQRQPRFVMAGRAKKLIVKRGTAYLE